MPRLRTVVEAEVLEEVGYFDYLDMEMVDEGLLIRAKSPLFGKWIENITDKKVHRSTAGSRCYDRLSAALAGLVSTRR